MTAKQTLGVNAPDGSHYVTLVDGAGNLGPVTGAVTQSGTWTVQPGNTANTTAWLVKDLRSTTTALTNVTSSNADTTVLAANTNRLGATVYNDSTAILYLLLGGGTSSTTNYTTQMATNAYYEVPFNYTGTIKGIWASANGAARVTELT